MIEQDLKIESVIYKKLLIILVNIFFLMFNHNTTEETTNHIFKRKNVDVQQSVEEVDPTDYLRMLSENDDKAY